MSQQRPILTLDSDQPTIFGHPTGLYNLFFAEMWERFSFYGMRALLSLYLIKGFLGYGDSEAYTVYGAYTALVYMTPFFGGMLADRLLGSRKAIVLGGIMMAVGASCLMIQDEVVFFTGLGLQIIGNGFFKPNISNIVGTLYKKFPERRDGGFTIFYIGINLGAAMAPLLCGYIGETYGWSWGFGLATVGMLVGLMVFVVKPIIAQIVIGCGAVTAFASLLWFHPSEMISTMASAFVALALLVSATVAILALHRGGLPTDAGAPPDPEKLKRKIAGVLPIEFAVYIIALLMAPVFMLFVSGFAPLMPNGEPLVFIGEDILQEWETHGAGMKIAAVLVEQISTPAGIVLVLASLVAYGYLIYETFRMEIIARQRMYVVLILMFFCMLFWAFFEQAGSSINIFTDRNVDRVFDRAVQKTITEEDIGKTVKLQPTQEQFGYRNGEQMFTSSTLNVLREKHKAQPDFEIDWKVTDDDIGMKIAPRSAEIPTSAFQAVNPIYILVFGLVFTALWTFLGTHGLEPSTPFKFALGLLQLGLGFAALWYGTYTSDARGMVLVWWLLLAYLLHTTGELCLSPVGLSMITKLSPAILVSTVMGGWFLSTAVSQFLAGMIAQFTGVGEGEGASVSIPPPIDTVHTYGNVYGIIAIAAGASAAICFCLVPLLKKWMHEGEE